MNKLLFLGKGLLFLCLFSTHFFQAQTVNTSYATQINSTFANLDKTKIPHKLLVDYAMEFEELSAYNGTLTNENLVNVGNFTGIYNTLLMARVQSNVAGLVNPITFKTNWNNLRQANKIVLSGLYYKYNEFKPDAPNNTITITNGKLYDKYINGVWQNPYNEKQVFAVATPIVKYNSLTMEVQLPNSLWYTNQSSSILNLAIDFNDGLGYQTASFDQLKTVTYTTAGLKEWKYKLTLTNGQILYSHSKIFIDAEIPPTNNTTYNRTINQPCSQDAFGIDKVEFYGTRQYLGTSNQAILEIDYAFNDCVIRKPLFVVEGFDSGLLGIENGLGDVDYSKFKKSASTLFSGSVNLPAQLNTYDIIYINFKNGKDYMQRNAYLVQDIIKWVNSVKQGSLPNVVLGQSMGGVIGRYALRDMENLGEAHQTNLYISHDAPHQGANMPIAIQYFARHLADQFVSTPVGDMNINVSGNGGAVSIEDLQDLLDAPGTKQLLANYISSDFSLSNSVGDSFRTELRNMGYPQQTRNISLSNGNHCAIPQNFNPGDNLFSLTGNAQTKLLTDLILSLTPLGGISSITLAVLFDEPGLLIGILPGNSKFDLNFTGKALPTAGTTAQIYKGRIAFTKTLFSLFGWTPRITVTLTDRSYNNPVNLSYDYYPGGKYNSFISNGGTSASNILASYGINLQARENFNFIPSPSALDVGNANVVLNNNDYFVKYNSSTPPTGSRTIPFNNFTTSHNTTGINENHISFNTRNGNWLALELDNISNNEDNFNCLNFCSNTQITGGSYLCSTGIYSVTNEATSVSWSITEGNSLVTYTTNGNEITLNQVNTNNSGYITISVNYGNSKCGFATATKRVWVGNPDVQDQNIYGGSNNVYTSTSSTFSVTSVPGASQYYWFIYNSSTNCGCTTDSNGLTICPQGTVLPKFSGSNSSILTSSSTSTSINWGNCSGTYVVNCIAKNPCGEDGIYHKVVNVINYGGGGSDPCEQSLTVYPNPIEGGEINIVLPPPGDPCGEIPGYAGKMNEDEKTESEIRIYDLFGNQVYFNKMKGKKSKINVNLKRGHYVLNVFINNGKVKREVLIVK